MKNLKIPGGIILCLISLQLTAQLKAPLNELKEKPFLFSGLPEKVILHATTLDKIFEGYADGKIKIPVEQHKSLEGILIEKLERSRQVTSVNIRLPQFDQALFTISRITTTDGAISYTGRIVHIKYADVMIVKQENEEVSLVKEKQSLFLVE